MRVIVPVTIVDAARQIAWHLTIRFYLFVCLCFQMDPARSEVFRGLGGAYQSQGQHQMAFASYQQAINLAPSDLLAYLKLGMLYEDLVRKNGRTCLRGEWVN